MAAFVFFAIIVSAIGLGSLIARRALPVVLGGLAIWLMLLGGFELVAALLTGAATSAVAAFVLDMCASEERIAPLTVALEVLSSVAVAMLLAFAVLNKLLDFASLCVAIGAAGILAASGALRFRLMV